MWICSPECISVHLILTPWEAVYVHVELCNSVMKHPPVPELCTSIQSVLDSVLEPLKMCPDCHWHGNAECRSVLCWFMSPIFMETFFFYASLAQLRDLSSRTWPRSGCDAHLCIDELLQREGVCFCNVWAGAAPRCAWMQGEQCSDLVRTDFSYSWFFFSF